jgi:hypothetical protein
MASIIITIPDAILPRVLDGFALANGYVEILEDGSSETKAQFARRKIIEFVKSSVRKAEVQQAYDSAVATAAQNAESQITIT